jgi:hypothetical protein
VEIRLLLGAMAAAIDLGGNRHHVQPIGMIVRHGKAQERQLPGAQHPAAPFNRILRFHLSRLPRAARVLRDSGRSFHLRVTLAVGGKHEAALAPHARLDPKAHLLQLPSDVETEFAFTGVDQDRNGGVGAEEL